MQEYLISVRVTAVSKLGQQAFSQGHIERRGIAIETGQWAQSSE